MTDAVRTQLDNLALTEAAFIRMTAPEFWATVEQDHFAAEDAIDAAMDPICGDCDGCGLKTCGAGCGLNDSPISRMEYAIDQMSARIDDDCTAFWREWFVHECRRMIEAVRTIRKGIA